jgi:hypothetical protein
MSPGTADAEQDLAGGAVDAPERETGNRTPTARERARGVPEPQPPVPDHTASMPTTGPGPHQSRTSGRGADEPDDAPWRTADPDAPVGERTLRGIIGGGASQVSSGAALRARDAARPRPEHLARAETDIRVVQRNWTPRD